MATREQVLELAKVASAKQIAANNHRCSNVYGKKTEDLVDQMAEARIAEDEWLRADAAYRRAFDEWQQSQ